MKNIKNLHWIAKQPDNAHGWWVIHDENGEIGSCDGGFEKEEALLMAAAPNLYHALSLCVQVLCGEALTKKSLERALEEALEAIKKVKGAE
jgi:hypothetical protein